MAQTGATDSIMTHDHDSPLEFPCRFPIKVMGHAHPGFEAVITDIVRQHVPGLSDAAVTSRPSKGGKYLALTITIEARSREQLDTIYQALSAHEWVIMSL